METFQLTGFGPDDSDQPALVPALVKRTLRRSIVGGVRRGDAMRVVEELLDDRDRLLAELATAKQGIARLETTVADLRSELSGWRAHELRVEEELKLARDRAIELEREARQRVERLENEMQGRAATLVDRACAEAASIIETARRDANDMHAREQVRIEDARSRVERLTVLHSRVSSAIRMAMVQFERGLFDLGGALPTSAIAQELSTAAAIVSPEPASHLRVVEPDPLPTEPVPESRDVPPPGPPEPPSAARAPAALSPTWLIIELFPIEDFPVLTRFERSLGEIDGVIDVHVRSFEGGVAELHVHLEQPAPLADLIQRSCPLPVTIDAQRPEHLKVQVRDASTVVA